MITSPYQLVYAALPVLLIIATTLVTAITQRIWLTKNYLILFIATVSYLSIGLWLDDFDLSSLLFRFSLMPFLYVFFCYGFHFLFRKLKPKTIERNYPVYVVFTDVPYADDHWSKKLVEEPTSLDKRISMWLTIFAVFSVLILMAV